MYTGSCLCGKIQFQVIGSISNIVHCHCSQCRKAQGSAYATNGVVNAKDFSFTKGETELTAYPLTDDQTRYFCKHCGSPMLSRRKSDPEHVRIRLGTIESDITERPVAHIFATSKANWETICGDLPQYESYEPGRHPEK